MVNQSADETRKLQDARLENEYEAMLMTLQSFEHDTKISMKFVKQHLDSLHSYALQLESENERLREQNRHLESQLNDEVEYDEEGYHNMAAAIRDLEEENQELRIRLRSIEG